jgi:hypothetical protein
MVTAEEQKLTSTHNHIRNSGPARRQAAVAAASEAQGQVSRTPTQLPGTINDDAIERPGRARSRSKLHRPPSIALARKHEGVGLGNPASGHVVG